MMRLLITVWFGGREIADGTAVRTMIFISYCLLAVVLRHKLNSCGRLAAISLVSGQIVMPSVVYVVVIT